MKILYVKNNSVRIKEFQVTTTIYEEDGQKYVKKEASHKEAIPHLMSMKKSYELLNKSIINPKVELAKIIKQTPTSLTFEFIEGITLEKILYEALEKSQDRAQEVIDNYKDFVLSSFKAKNIAQSNPATKQQNLYADIDYSDEGALFFEGASNIDLIFSNIIHKDEKIYIIDYEWVFDFALPVEYIYFRAIDAINNPDITKRNFSYEQIAYFEKLDNNFTLDYVFDKSSFFQTQHYYLKHRVDFQSQDQVVQEQYRYIKELEDIAQSLRIKNRLKRLNPARLLAPIKIIQQNPLLLKKALFYIKRGEFSYLWTKFKEKSNLNLAQGDALGKIDPAQFFKPFSIEDYPMGERVIDIIIPVYNGYKFLTPLFDSIEKSTTCAYRLIVVNDCSPDERVKPLLVDRLQKHPTAIFIDNSSNLGFVKSVNVAYKQTNDHFVILNTDTEVPKFWLERLMYPILHMDKIASTTPFTNAGQIASFPNFISDNTIFEDMSVDALDEVFKEVNPDEFYAKAPTGVGFCMGVNHALATEIGLFDEEEFDKGYGEENDWCQRAIKSGYSNLIVPNLFVYHKHGGSFLAEEKKQLMEANAIKLLKKHPNYDQDVQKYIQSDPHKMLRDILVIVASSKNKEGLYLVIDQALGGGANHYTKARIKEYLLEKKGVLELIYDYYAHTFILHFNYKKYHFSFAIRRFEEVKEFITHLGLQEIFVNDLVSFKQPIEVVKWVGDLAQNSGAKITLPIHDYFPICANYTLLNPEGLFCEIPDSLKSCQECMKKNDLEWRTFLNEKVDMDIWRGEWSLLLDRADKIICFSNSSKELLQRAYRDLDADKIEINPHQVEPLPAVKPLIKDSKNYTTTIGILGAINQAKGAGIIEELTKRVDAQKLPVEIVLIGEISKNIPSDSFRSTGRYKREDLPHLIKQHQIDICLIPSVCPETFSYTTQEIIMMQMPLMVFDIGAPPERVESYDKGVVLKKNYVENILKYIEDFQG